MLRRLLAALLALAVLAPTAAAFPTDERPLLISYPQSKTPVVLSMGEVALSGDLRGGLLVGGASGTRLGPIPTLIVAERTDTGARNTTFENAVLEIHAGDLVWPFGTNGHLQLETRAPYGFGLGVPEAPLPSEAAEAAGAGFLLIAELVEGDGSWSGPTADLAVLDASVTILGASGSPIAGWDRRLVNQGATTSSPEVDTLFRLEGAFDAQLAGAILAGAAGAGNAALSVKTAEVDDFEAVRQSMQEKGGALFGGGGEDNPLASEGGPLDMLGSASALLNGAILVIPGSDETGGSAIATESTVGGDAFELGMFNLLRGDGLEVRWQDEQMRIQGEPSVALGKDGFAIEQPFTLLFLPILSLVLWLVALGAIVLYFVKKPEDAPTQWTLRIGSFALYLIALAIVFLIWDASFAATFGTSAIREARANGISAETLPQLGILLSLELVPWGIAGLLFALPTRIAAVVGLRYLGKGKSFKGLASAAGIVALGVIGPFYAMWAFNLVLQRALAMAAP